MARKVDAQQLRLEALDQPSAPVGSGGSVSGSRPRGVRVNVMGDHVDNARESKHGRARPSPTDLLETPGALLTRSHLRKLGLERRAIDAVFRELPVVALPGYSRPLVRVEAFLALVEDCTYRDDRVRPCHA